MQQSRLSCPSPGFPVLHQASLSFTISWSLLNLMPIESVMPSNHLILCCPLLLLPSIFPSIRVFSSESTLCIRWPKYWSFSFSISPSNEYSGWFAGDIIYTMIFICLVYSLIILQFNNFSFSVQFNNLLSCATIIIFQFQNIFITPVGSLLLF